MISPASQYLMLPSGVTSKRHSNEWITIYHLFYSGSDSVNGHIPKKPYTNPCIQATATFSSDLVKAMYARGSGEATGRAKRGRQPEKKKRETARLARTNELRVSLTMQNKIGWFMKHWQQTVNNRKPLTSWRWLKQCRKVCHVSWKKKKH